MAARLSVEQFVKQMGPFALVRRPPPQWLRAQGVDENAGVARTAMAKAADISTNILSLLFEFDGLSINIIPPLSSEDVLVVGRLPDSDVVVDDPSVSKKHATIRWSDGQKKCTVKDEGSTNGTYINDATTGGRESVLRDGDIVTFGEVPFWYLSTSTLYSKISNRSTSHRLGSRSG
ncbi:MAG: FHA domain-containing protein [Myxococcaceae bacterium]